MRIFMAASVLLLCVSCVAGFKCPVPLDTGLECKSVTEVYRTYTTAGKVDKAAPAQLESRDKVSTGSQETEKPPVQRDGTEMIVRQLSLEDRVPLRIPPKVVRLWFAPFEDEDGDLNQGGYIYMEIAPERKWIIGEKTPEKQTESSVRTIIPFRREGIHSEESRDGEDE